MRALFSCPGRRWCRLWTLGTLGFSRTVPAFAALSLRLWGRLSTNFARVPHSLAVLAPVVHYECSSLARRSRGCVRRTAGCTMAGWRAPGTHCVRWPSRKSCPPTPSLTAATSLACPPWCVRSSAAQGRAPALYSLTRAPRLPRNSARLSEVVLARPWCTIAAALRTSPSYAHTHSI